MYRRERPLCRSAKKNPVDQMVVCGTPGIIYNGTPGVRPLRNAIGVTRCDANH